MELEHGCTDVCASAQLTPAMKSQGYATGRKVQFATRPPDRKNAEWTEQFG